MDSLSNILSCFVLMCGVIHLTSSAKLPSYIKPCKADGNLNDCALKNGREAIPKLLPGDPKFKIPKLDPFDIKQIKIDHGSNSFGLKLDLMNCKLTGLKNAQFIASRMDLKKHHVEWDIKVPRAQIYGDYKADGKILVLPITGTGKSNITLLNMDITFKFDYVLEKRNGKEFVRIPEDKTTIDFTTSRLYVKFENLFNGDKLLADNMNQFLDENWKDVHEALGSPVVKSLTPIFSLIINGIAKDVPYNELFPK